MKDEEVVKKVDDKCHRVSTKQAAIEMGCSEQYIRILMQRGLLPIGLVFRSGSKWTYIIIRDHLDSYLKKGATWNS